MVGTHTGRLDGLDGLKGYLQLHNLTGRHPTHCHFRDDALQVVDEVQLFVCLLAEFGMTEEILHHIETLIDGFGILQWENEPTVQHTATHRSDGLVDNLEQ